MVDLIAVDLNTIDLWAIDLNRQHQVAESPYAFNLNLDTLKDSVSGNSLSCIYGGTRYDEVNGIQTAFTSSQPVVTEKGLRSVGSYQNLLKYSEDITNGIWGVSHTAVKLNANTLQFTEVDSLIRQYIASQGFTNTYYGTTYYPSLTNSFVKYYHKINRESKQYTAQMQLKAGTTTEVKVAFWTLTTGELGLIFEEDGFYNNDTIQLKQMQVNVGTYSKPYIPTTDTAATSTTESGTASAGEATNGAYLENVATNFPVLKSSLESKGTIQFNWTPAYNQANVTGNLNILAFNASTITDAIYYDATNGLLKVNDGTNTASCALNAVADTTYSIKISYDNTIGMKVFVDETSGDLTDFDGFTVGTDIIYGLDNVELHYTKDLKVLKTASWS